MKKLLVAIQPGYTATPALDRAKHLADKGDVEIMLYSAVFDAVFAGDHYGDGTSMQGTRNAMAYAEQQKLHGIKHQLLGHAKSVSTQAEWYNGAGEGIVKAAQRFGADLIIISSTQHSLASRLLLNNTDWTVLQQTTVPVLVAHHREFHNYEQVMVAVTPLQSDESPEDLSREAIEQAQGLAQYFGGETHMHNTDAPVARAIPEVAKELSADLVVLGLTPHTAATTFLVDSSAERVVDHLDCDVLAVPQPRREALTLAETVTLKEAAYA